MLSVSGGGGGGAAIALSGGDASVDILALHAGMSPDKPALIDEDGTSHTYAQLNARANRCANALLALGVRSGDRCLHIHHNRVEAFELGHALRKLHVVTTPINWRLSSDEIAYLIADSGATAVVAADDFTAVCDEARARLEDGDAHRLWVVFGDQGRQGWLAYEELLAGGAESEPPTPAEMTGPTMIYTAGTTGRPKGAYRSAGIDVGVVFSWIQNLHLRTDDVHLLAGPGYHSAPAAFSGLQQLLGATVVVLKRFDAERALQLIDRHQVTTTFMAPTLVRRILDLPEAVRRRYDMGSMRALIVAAAPFPAELKRRAVEYFGECVYEFYGASETGLVTLIGPDELLRKPDSCGRPLEGVDVRILDDDGNDLATGQAGELWIRSAGIIDGYFNNPAATEQNRRDGFFTVGDVAWIDDEGFVYICDRKIDMVISGGVNIYPAEVEAVIAELPAVEDVAVIGVPDDEWGERLRAVVKTRPGMSVTADEIIAFVGSRLASFKRPRAVDFVDDFPRDPSGKLLKRVIRDRYWAQAGRSI
jgi:acyl-CoA synthetase (AMP-forming)/AMP-acid ligase II